jgi:hypothetical protein
MDGRRETQRKTHAHRTACSPRRPRARRAPAARRGSPRTRGCAVKAKAYISSEVVLSGQEGGGRLCTHLVLEGAQLWAPPLFLCRALLRPVLLSERFLSTERSEVEREVRVMLVGGWAPCTGWWEERAWGHDSGRWKSKVRLIGETWWHNGSLSHKQCQTTRLDVYHNAHHHPSSASLWHNYRLAPITNAK